MLVVALDSVHILADLEEQQMVELTHQEQPGVWLRLLIDGLLLEPFLHPGDPTWRWRWNPGAASGVHLITLHVGEDEQALIVRVLPRMLDRERYEVLLHDLRLAARDLALMLGGAFEDASATPYLPQSSQLGEPRGILLAYYTLFEQRLDLFIRAVQQIAARPRDHLRAESEEIPFGQARTLDASAPPLSFEQVPPAFAPQLQEAIRPGGGVLPTHSTQRRSRPNMDTYEHRLLKRTIDLLLRRVQRIESAAKEEAERSGTNRRAAEMQRIIAGCGAAAVQLREVRSLAFLRDVGELDAFRGPTPVLQRDAAYREVYRTWMTLRREPLLAPDAPLFQIPIAELPRLYELWCALQVALVLTCASGWVIDHQELIGDGVDGEPVVHIEPGDLLRIQRDPWTIVLRYQPRYRRLHNGSRAQLGSLDRHTRVPDLVLEAHGPDNALRLLIFDAKYRLDADGHHVPLDALAEAYAYKGSIGQLGQPCVDAAFLLYPAEAHMEQYPSRVGAIPLMPGASSSLADVITHWMVGIEQESEVRSQESE